MNSFSMPAIAASETAAICYRQSLKDSRKVWAWYHATFIGPAAVARYEVIGQFLGAIACWVYAYVKTWVAAQVNAALDDEPAEVLTPASMAPPLTFAQWVLTVVFKVHARILRLLRHSQIAASSLDGPQLQPCP